MTDDRGRRLTHLIQLRTRRKRNAARGGDARGELGEAKKIFIYAGEEGDNSTECRHSPLKVADNEMKEK